MYQICSKLTMKKIGWRYWPISVVFIVVIFEHILRTVLAFSIVGFEEVNIQSFKVNDGDTTTMFQTCSKLKIKKLGWCYWLVQASLLLLTLNIWHTLLWRFHCWLSRSTCQMRGIVLDICGKSEVINLQYVL